MAGCSIREEGLRAAALPGRVAAADAVALDAGPRADERVGYVEERVLRFCAVREQVLLGREYKLSHLCGRSLTRRRRAGDAKGPQNYLTPEHTAASHASHNDGKCSKYEPHASRRQTKMWSFRRWNLCGNQISDAPRRMTSLIISTQVGTAQSAS